MKTAKSDSTKAKIIESATYCLANMGERKATFQAIADHCKVSQPLVVKYLKKQENIFPVVMDHWLNHARNKTQEALLTHGSPEEKLRNYLSVSIFLFNEKPEISKIYILVHYYAAIDEKIRKINTQIKDVAIQRISDILQEGITQKAFEINDIKLAAKTIHNTLVGLLVGVATEVARPIQVQLPAALEQIVLSYIKK